MALADVSWEAGGISIGSHLLPSIPPLTASRLHLTASNQYLTISCGGCTCVCMCVHSSVQLAAFAVHLVGLQARNKRKTRTEQRLKIDIFVCASVRLPLLPFLTGCYRLFTVCWHMHVIGLDRLSKARARARDMSGISPRFSAVESVKRNMIN